MFELFREARFARRSFENNLPFRQRIDAVCRGKRLLDKLLDKKHSRPAGAETPDHVENAIDENRRQAGRRFIQHQQTRTPD